ncbi:MAG: flagellar filament capping protein FliD, partial [Planctomycetota bacterium]
ETTLGELLEAINAAAPDKLKAEIAPVGDRLILTDLTSGGGNFAVESLGESTVLDDLGLDGGSVGGVITGRRILGGLKTVLLSSLEGGRGLGSLGGLALTDRSGASDTVDLSAADTLDDVIDLINAAAVGIVARVNQAQNGIELADTTGSSAGNLIVANADATGTADKLGIAVDDAVNSVGSGDLHLQVIAQNTRLEDLNGGAGVARGRLTLYDTNGQKAQLNLAGDNVQTMGDVIRAINRLGLEIEAELNETGDGIRLRDLAHGTQTLRVVEGSSTTAADLHLLGGMTEVEIDGQTTQVVDGSTTQTIELSSTDSLQDLRDRINDLAAGVTATIWSDGSSKPYRLALQSNQPGRAGELLVDTSAVFSKSLDFQETVRARDALMALGDPSLGGSSVLISSSSNSFDSLISGAVLTMKQPSATPVTVTIDTTDTNLVASVKTMVENYNRFREGLLTLTQYDVESETGSVLTGDATALRLDTDLSRLLSGRFDGVGSIRSLGQLGIEFKDDGALKLDESKLKSKFAEDPEAVKTFFTHEQFGLAAKLDALIERLSGQQDSLLTARLGALDSRIAQNEEKIAFFNARLEKQRDSLYLQFYRMELAISRVQASYSAVDSIKAMPSYILGSRE